MRSSWGRCAPGDVGWYCEGTELRELAEGATRSWQQRPAGEPAAGKGRSHQAGTARTARCPVPAPLLSSTVVRMSGGGHRPYFLAYVVLALCIAVVIVYGFGLFQ